MLSSASSLVARAKASRDVEKLFTGSSVAPGSLIGSSRRIQTHASRVVNAPTGSMVAKEAQEGQSASLLSRSTLSTVPVRAYHTSKASWKKKVANTKAQATQGRRGKEKANAEESASLKLVMEPGPKAAAAAGKQKLVVKTQADLDAEREARVAAAAADPEGLLINQEIVIKSQEVAAQVGAHMDTMAEVVKRMRDEYPATYRFMAYSWMRTPPSMRLKMVMRSGDFQGLAKDKRMKPFHEWLQRLNGHGSVENYLHKQIRRGIVQERMKLAATWQETDASLAELKSEEQTLDVLLPDEHVTPEELASLGAEEREEIREIISGEILDDPELQLVLSYINDPRASIDPTGSLASLDFEPISEVDVANLMQQRTQLNHHMLGFRRNILAQMPELERQSLEELLSGSRAHTIGNTESSMAQRTQDAQAADYLAQAEAQGLTNSAVYKERLSAFQQENKLEFVPNVVAMRILLDSMETNVQEMYPNLRRLVDQVGPREAERVASATMDAHLHDLKEQAFVVKTKRLADDPEYEEEQAAIDALDREVDEANEELLEEALIPDYSESVTREFPERGRALDNVKYSGEQEMLDQYKASLDAFIAGTPEDESTLSDADKALNAAKTTQEFTQAVQKLIGIPNLSVREAGKQYIEERLLEAAYRAGVLAPEDQTINTGLAILAKRVREYAQNPKSLLKTEDATKLVQLADTADLLSQSPIHLPLPEEHLPESDQMEIGNPYRQFEEVKDSLRVLKDSVLDMNADLNEFQSRLDETFENARKLTQRMLDQETQPEYVKQLQSMHAAVYGDALPHPLESVGADDVMAQWSQHMKENIIMMHARSSVEREAASVARTIGKQRDPLMSFPQPLIKALPDSGIYSFSADDISADVPVEDRIYLSSDGEVDEIFSAKNVGKYLTLTDRDLKRYLPEGFSARLTKREFATTGSKALLIRPQALEAIANLKAQLSSSFVVPKVPHGAANSSTSKASLEDSVAKPMLLHGYRGCGKSAVLSEVIYWARRSGWLVVSVPDGAQWLSSGVYVSKNAVEGTWDQPKLFVRLFAHLLNAHSDKLKEIPLKSTNVKIGKIQPKTLFEVVEYGSVLEQYAAQCFTVFKNEIRKVVEFPVLLAFDSYNALYNPSIGFKDPESTSYYKDPLDPYNMSLGRLFYDAHFNHKLAYGTFIGALSDSIPTRRFVELSSTKERAASADKKALSVSHITPKYLEVPPYSIQEFTTVMEHYKHKHWVRTNMRPGSSSELYIYQLTSGFGDAIWSYSKRL